MRNRHWIYAAAVAGIGAALMAAPTTAPSKPAPVTTRKLVLSDYDVVIDRNMFVKNRAGIRPQAYRPETRYTGPTRQVRQEELYVLTGLIIEDGNPKAVFERQGQGLIKVSPGDAIAQGRIAEIGLDYVEYASGTKLTRVDIGRNLVGEYTRTEPEPTSRPATASSGESSTTSGSSSTSSSTSTPADDSTLSIIEKLKRRREAEEKGGK